MVFFLEQIEFKKFPEAGEGEEHPSKAINGERPNGGMGGGMSTRPEIATYDTVPSLESERFNNVPVNPLDTISFTGLFLDDWYYETCNVSIIQDISSSEFAPE